MITTRTTVANLKITVQLKPHCLMTAAATGLTSLDLAAVIALLERRWKVDPFLEHVSITDIRTVGELCRAYELGLAGAVPDDDDLEREAAERVQRMRE